jgi:hypothetical protein
VQARIPSGCFNGWVLVSDASTDTITVTSFANPVPGGAQLVLVLVLVLVGVGVGGVLAAGCATVNSMLISHDVRPTLEHHALSSTAPCGHNGPGTSSKAVLILVTWQPNIAVTKS